MSIGKQICKALKELRKRIADANGIPFEIEECIYDGPCQGTCPKCEQELRLLQAALHDKESRGEPIVIDNIVTEDELCRALDEHPMDYDWNEADDYVPTLQGIPALPDHTDNRNLLEKEFTEAIENCIELSRHFPEVSIYIDPMSHTPIVVKSPKKEGEALFGFERCDWRKLMKTGLPNDKAIREYIHNRLEELRKHTEEIELGGDISYVPKRGNNRLIAENILDQLLDIFDKQNMVFSPLGVASLMEMTQLCVGRYSLISRHLASLLNGFKIEEFDEYKLEGITLEHSTSLWYDRSLGLIKKSFVAEIQHLFGSKPHEVNFADSVRVKALVDEWASEHTHGMIKQLDLQMTHKTLMLLIDALYMKATWDVPFDEDETRHRSFYNADGTTSRVDMMHLRTHEAEYECTNDYQAVNLQYSGCDVFMTIVLPHKGKDLATVMRYRDWLEIDSEDDYDIDLRMPRFRFDCKVELNDTLKALGLGELFDTETAMPKMTDAPAHISQIFQQCVVSVTEQGTEATSVSVAKMEVGCLPPKEQPKCHRMTVDRPFGFAIQDIYHNVLFMGIVNHLDDVEPKQPPVSTRSGKYITSITIAGTSHIKIIETLANDISIDKELYLKHEPNNRYDCNAIGIYLGKERVGFVPRENNQILANLLDAGVDLFAIVTEAEWRGNWLNIKADILISQ